MGSCKSYILKGFRALSLGLPLVLTSSYLTVAQSQVKLASSFIPTSSLSRT